MGRTTPLASDDALRSEVSSALRRGLSAMIPGIFVKHGHSRAAGTRAMARCNTLVAAVHAVAAREPDADGVLDKFAEDALRLIANDGCAPAKAQPDNAGAQRLDGWLRAMIEAYATLDPAVRTEREIIARARPVPVRPAETAAQSKGVSKAQIDFIRREILGLQASP